MGLSTVSVGAVSSSVVVGSVFMYLERWAVKSCDWVQVYTVHCTCELRRSSFHFSNLYTRTVTQLLNLLTRNNKSVINRPTKY